MKIMVFGGSGMLGHKVYQALRSRFELSVVFRGGAAEWQMHPLYASAPAGSLVFNVDVRQPEHIEAVLTDQHPDVVINCVGIVKQLKEAYDPALSIEINALFPHRLAVACAARGVRLIHVSTDCVFSGRSGLYRETDLADADDLYGRSKRLGEVTSAGALTLRTSIIGRELARSGSLVEWFLSAHGPEVDGYTNMVFSGFPTIVFARILGDVVEHHPELSGLYHVAADPISKYDLLRRLRNVFRTETSIRPRDEPICNRSLDGSQFRHATGIVAPTWDESVELLFRDAAPYEEWRHERATL